MAEGILVALLASAATVVLMIVTCISCCCCCCAPAIMSLFTRKSKQDWSSSHISGRQAEYSSLPQANVYSSVSQESVPIVEAYVVPPLAAINNQRPHSAMSSGIDDSIVHPIAPGGFRDIWATALFGLQLVLVVAVASQAVWPSDDTSTINSTESKNSIGLIFSFIITVAVVTSMLASSMLYFVVSHADNIIVYMLYWNIFSLAAISLLSLLTFQLFACLLFGVLAAVTYCYYLGVQDRIPFATAVLSTSCSALRPKLYPLLAASAGGLACQVAWLVLWSSAAYVLQQQWSRANQYNNDDEEVAAQFTGGFILLTLSLYWTSQVIQYVVSVTAGGTVASWYFQPHHPAPVKGALFRALTTSFGSICVGALLVAVIMVLKHLVQVLKRREERRRQRDREEGSLVVICLLAVLETVINCIENAVRYINRYAYAYVAAYGYDFFTSGKLALDLFERRGWTAIVNDNLISYVFSIVAMGIAVLGGIVGGIALPLLAILLTSSASHPMDEHAIVQSIGVGLIAGAAIAWIVASAVVSLLASAVAMIFVCFAEDPATLQAYHPDEFEHLLSAWQKFHPSTIAWVPVAPSGANTPRADYSLTPPYAPSISSGIPSRSPGAATAAAMLHDDGDLELQEYSYQRPYSVHHKTPTVPPLSLSGQTHSTTNPPPYNPHFNTSKQPY